MHGLRHLRVYRKQIPVSKFKVRQQAENKSNKK